MKEFTLTVPYSSQSIAFIVKENRRSEFTKWEDIFDNEKHIIGIPEFYYSENIIKRYFKQGKAWKRTCPACENEMGMARVLRAKGSSGMYWLCQNNSCNTLVTTAGAKAGALAL